MPSGDDIQAYLAGAWRLMMGKPDGVRALDVSADGFWNSFFAILVAFPALSRNECKAAKMWLSKAMQQYEESKSQGKEGE